MAAFFLILCFGAVFLAGCVVVGILIKRRAFWPAFFLAIAFIAILVLLYSAAVNAPPITSQKRATAQSSTGSSSTVLPVYVAVFGYGLMGLIATMIAGIPGALLLSIVFILTVPWVYTFYRNYLLFSAVITMAVLAGGTLSSLLTLALGRSGRKAIGSDSFSHLLYYLALLMLISASSFCFDIVIFTESLAVGFVAACVGSYGILIETNIFKSVA